MRSEGERALSAFGLVLLLGLALAGCRGMLEPEPSEDGHGLTGYSLSVRVIPPPGARPSEVEIDHDNWLWIQRDDNLRRRGSERVPATGSFVFEDLVRGPTLITYQWDGPGLDYQECDWGVVDIPSEGIVVDLSRPNLKMYTPLRLEGQTLDHERVRVRLYRDADLGHRSYWTEAEGDSIATTLAVAEYHVRSTWYYPSTSLLSSVEAEAIDSLSVPGHHDIGLELDRAWLVLSLGGEPLRNVEVNLSTETPRDETFEWRTLNYRPREWAGDVVPLLVDGGLMELELTQERGESIFPRRSLWREVAVGDTLRIDLGEHRLRVLLRQGGQPVPHARLRLHSGRADTDGLAVNVDESGERTVFLPTGRYGASLDSPDALALPVGTSIEVHDDLEVTLEVRER